MVRRKAKTEDEKSIPEMADELACKTVRGMCKDGKLTPQGRSLAKLMDRLMPDEKVDEWGWNLSRKERAAIKRRAAEKRAAEEKKKAEAQVCSEVQIETLPADQQEPTRKEWGNVLRPVKRREPWLCQA